MDNTRNPSVQHQADRYALVTELMNCSLETLLNKWKDANCTAEELAEVVPSIALQLISTIRDFHTVPDSNGDVMLHNDLNLKNIMIDCRGNVRVIDDGNSRHITEEDRRDAQPDHHQTRDKKATHLRLPEDSASRAPEIRKVLQKRAEHHKKTNEGSTVLDQQHLPWSFETDVYSLGWVLDQVGQLGGNTNMPTTHFQCCLADLIDRCTRESPSERPTCDELLNHPLMWTPEESIIFLAQFVNPFLPTNTDDFGSNKFRVLSLKFLRTRNYEEWMDVMEKTTNTELKTFWVAHLAQVKKRADEAEAVAEELKEKIVKNNGGNWKMKPPANRGPKGDQKHQFQLLRVINNHVRYHHSPFVPEAALLEAFPHLVIDAYNIALSKDQEFGIGVREFLKPKRSPNSAPTDICC